MFEMQSVKRKRARFVPRKRHSKTKCEGNGAYSLSLYSIREILDERRASTNRFDTCETRTTDYLETRFKMVSWEDASHVARTDADLTNVMPALHYKCINTINNTFIKLQISKIYIITLIITVKSSRNLCFLSHFILISISQNKWNGDTNKMAEVWARCC